MGAGDFTALTVVDGAQVVQQQLARCRDQAVVTVDQLPMAQVQVDAGIADQLATIMLVQPGQGCLDRGLGEDRTLLAVVQSPCVEGDASVTADAAALAVVQAGAAHVHLLLGADHAALAVVQRSADQRGGAIGQQLASLIVQLALGGDRQRIGRRKNTAPAVIQGASPDGQSALAQQRALPLVEQVSGQANGQVFLAGNAATQAVIQLVAIQCQALTPRQQAVALVEQALHRERQAAVADDLAGGVVQLIGDHQHPGLAGDLALLIEDGLAAQVHALGGSDKAAVAVIQGRAGQVQRTVADEFARLLIEHTDGCLQVALGADTTGAVFELVGVEGQRTIAAQLAAIAVVQLVQLHVRGGLGADHARLAVIQIAAGEGQRAVGNDQAPLVDQAVAVQRQGGFAGHQAALAVVQLPCGYLLSPLADEVAFIAIVQQPGDGQVHHALGGDGTFVAVIQAGRLYCQAGRRENPQAVIDGTAGGYVEVAAQQFA